MIDSESSTAESQTRTKRTMTSFHLPASAINDLQRESIRRMIATAKNAHYVDLLARLNGQDVRIGQGDWLKLLEETPMTVSDVEMKLAQYEALFHLAAHDLVFLEEEDTGPFIRPVELTMHAGKLLRLYANVSDTFGYACADCEEMTLEEVKEVYDDACARFPQCPWVAAALWVQKKRGGPQFIEPIRKGVEKALAELRSKAEPNGDEIPE